MVARESGYGTGHGIRSGPSMACRGRVSALLGLLACSWLTTACDGGGALRGGPPDEQSVAPAESGDAGVDAFTPSSTPPPPRPRPVRDLATGDLSVVECADQVESPKDLYCTGLYARWPSRRIADDVQPFDPGLHLWSDGADKHRYIRLPPGEKIDTSDMDEWVFPVGTKLWKEFALGGHMIETRYLYKRADGTWLRTTYAWNDDETAATELVAGKTNVHGTSYEIPTQEECTTCHEGREDGVLGFEAIALSSPGATGLTMQKLVSAGLLTAPPTEPLVIPGNPTESAALGWLHISCGVACHNTSPASFAGWTGLHMRLEVGALGSVATTDTWLTAVRVASFFQPIEGETFFRIAPRDVGHSAIPYRDATRDDGSVQMPPIATHIVDAHGLALVKAWINAIP